MLLRQVREERWGSALATPTAPLPADTLSDLRTVGNEMSLWKLLEDMSNFEVVVVGLASGFKSLTNCDLVIFEEELLEGLGGSLASTDGPEVSPFAKARAFHRDFRNLTADAVLHFAERLRLHGIFVALAHRHVGDLMVDAVSRHGLAADGLADQLQRFVARRVSTGT